MVVVYNSLPACVFTYRVVNHGDHNHVVNCKDNHASIVLLKCTLSTGAGILLPKFHWRRSKWGRYCPVELANGNMVPGRMEFAVGYVFCYSCQVL